MYVFENNLGREQDHLNNFVQYVSRLKNNAIVLCEDDTKIGIHTDYHNKLQADQLAFDYITSEAVEFSSNLVCTNKDPKKDANSTKAKMMGQFRAFKEFTVTPAKGIPKIVRSCRHTIDLKVQRDKQDDLLRVCLNMFRAEKLVRENRVSNSTLDMITKRMRRRTMESAADLQQIDIMTRMKRQRLDMYEDNRDIFQMLENASDLFANTNNNINAHSGIIFGAH